MQNITMSKMYSFQILLRTTAIGMTNLSQREKLTGKPNGKKVSAAYLKKEGQGTVTVRRLHLLLFGKFFLDIKTVTIKQHMRMNMVMFMTTCFLNFCYVLFDHREVTFRDSIVRILNIRQSS